MNAIYEKFVKMDQEWEKDKKKAKTYKVARVSFMHWECSDGTNELWNNITALYTPDDKGVCTIPNKVELGNVTLDCESGTIYCHLPRVELETVILFRREDGPA